MNDPIYLLTFVAALGSGLVAGIFFAFSIFIMRALASVSPTSGIAAMQSINVMVLNRWFFAVFFGTAACCLVLVIAFFLHWQRPGAAYLLLAGLLYLVGTILVTIVCNVPLNDSLAAVDPATAEAASTWTNYLKTWTVWNHVRTVAAFAAAALFIAALCRASSSPDVARSRMSSPTPSTSLPDKPEDWPRHFEKQLNAGDLDAVMTLYEPEARFVTRTGETLVGHDAIRKALGELIEAKTQFHGQVVRAVIVGGIAQLHTDFEGTRQDDSGKTVPIQNKAIEVLRRQPNGSWKLIMGDPNGRE
jgi:uncharacterized membrane protein/ketosteroid isomerase-like protein